MSHSALKTGHVGLNVRDLERSVRFYQQVFGFKVLGESRETGREFAFLGTDHELLITLWQQSRDSFRTESAGLHHLSFQVDSIEAVQDAERRLKEIGAEFFHDGVVAHAEGANSGGIFFADPDGIRLEIFSPTGVQNNPAPHGHAPTCGFF